MLKIKIRVIFIYIEGKWIVMGLLEFEIYVFMLVEFVYEFDVIIVYKYYCVYD